MISLCIFICSARSGHSLFGSLLDAHPDIVIAHEFHAFRHVREGITREDLIEGLINKSESFSRAGRRWNGYDYKVPNQWQGRIHELKVIGDKMGAASVHELQKCPGHLRQLRELVGVPVKIFRMLRNPFDNIRTLARYHHRSNLDAAIHGYFANCEFTEITKSETELENWLDVYHEDLIANPKQVLADACQFLGVTAEPDYLQDCASIVFPEPRKRRHEITWTPEQRGRVEADIRRFPALSRYTFDS